MSESTARTLLTVASMVSILSAVTAIMLGLRGDAQGQAVIFLLLAVMGAGAAWTAYRRYRGIRSERWQRELEATNAELNQTLDQGSTAQPVAERASSQSDTPEEKAGTKP